VLANKKRRSLGGAQATSGAVSYVIKKQGEIKESAAIK